MQAKINLIILFHIPSVRLTFESLYSILIFVTFRESVNPVWEYEYM